MTESEGIKPISPVERIQESLTLQDYIHTLSDNYRDLMLGMNPPKRPEEEKIALVVARSKMMKMLITLPVFGSGEKMHWDHKAFNNIVAHSEGDPQPNGLPPPLPEEQSRAMLNAAIKAGFVHPTEFRGNERYYVDEQFAEKIIPLVERYEEEEEAKGNQ